MQQLKPGNQLNNKYKIVRLIGQGGFAFAYEAIQEPIGLKVCIKELFIKESRDTFLREGRILATLKSDSIVRVLDYFEENETSYIVLEYLEGVTLKDYVEEYGPISADQLFSVILPILSGLSLLHKQGLIHRDIAPDNLMVLGADFSGGSSQTLQLKLFDFGTARESGKDEYTCTLKDGYSPIEQVSSQGNQGPTTDIYALSATLWYCLTGKTPDGAYGRLLDDNLKRPSSLGIEIDRELENILMKGLSLQKEDRPQSVDEMLDLVSRKQAMKEEDNGSTSEKIFQKRKKVFLAGSIFCILAVLMLAGIFLYRKNTSLEYNAETMYQVTLTPDDKFTVAGYNESIKILEERLKLFSSRSRKYSLTENEGVLTMLLMKEDFPENTAHGDNYKSADVDTASVPEYVLKAYLTRAVDLVIQSREEGDTFNENLKLDQTRDFTLVWHKGSVPGQGDNGEEESGKNSEGYYELTFSKGFLSQNSEKLKSWNNNYAIYQDPDDIPSVTPYTTIPMKDGNGCYLSDNDNGAFSDLLKYNLTHSPLEHSFSISIEEQVDWQTDDKNFGKMQVRESDIDNLIYCSVYGSMTDGEETDCYQALRNRLDSLGISYALGKMDNLTSVTKGCDGATYRFLSVKANTSDEKLKYWDIWNLIACSHTFCLTDKEKNIAWIFDYTITADENGITIMQAELSDWFQDRDKTIYLSYINGSDTICMMAGKLQADGSCRFEQFANGTEVSDDNRWIVPLISSCMKNDLPAEVLPYDLKFRNKTVSDWKSLGLFTED